MIDMVRMQLNKFSTPKKLAQWTASPLSRIACSRLLHTPMRILDAYLNFLMGKGSGNAWSLPREIQDALACVYRERPVIFDVGANVGKWSQGFLAASPTARRIGALSFEFGSGDINSRTFFRDFWDFLTGQGFSLSRLTCSGRLLPIEDYFEDCEYFRGVSNYIAKLKNHPRRPVT